MNTNYIQQYLEQNGHEYIIQRNSDNSLSILIKSLPGWNVIHAITNKIEKENGFSYDALCIAQHRDKIYNDKHYYEVFQSKISKNSLNPNFIPDIYFLDLYGNRGVIDKNDEDLFYTLLYDLSETLEDIPEAKMYDIDYRYDYQTYFIKSSLEDFAKKYNLEIQHGYYTPYDDLICLNGEIGMNLKPKDKMQYNYVKYKDYIVFDIHVPGKIFVLVK